MEPVVDFALLDQILQRHDYKSSAVVTILQEIQKEYRYLPKEIDVYKRQIFGGAGRRK